MMPRDHVHCVAIPSSVHAILSLSSVSVRTLHIYKGWKRRGWSAPSSILQSEMAPVATSDSASTTNGSHLSIDELKQKAAGIFNPFYSPDAGDENDSDYKFAQYKVRPFDGRSRLRFDSDHRLLSLASLT